MEVTLPTFEAGLDFVGRVAECRLHIVTPPDVVRQQVPIPNAVVGGARHELKPVLTQLQSLLGQDFLAAQVV